jgi:hypothetical protein
MENLKLGLNKNREISLKDVFSDADGDNLSYVVDAYPTGVVEAKIENGVLKLISLKPGTSNITISALDGKGGEVHGDFQVQVLNSAGFNKYIIYAGAGVLALALIIILIIALGKRKGTVKESRRSKKESRKVIKETSTAIEETKVVQYNGQVMLEIKNEITGIVDPPQFKRLEEYKSGISLFELLYEAPEFAETKKIRLIPDGNRIYIKNRSTCLVEKNNVKPDKINEFYIENGDKLKVTLLSSKKSIKIEYFVK